MMISEEIEKQLNAGFSSAEIRTNLRSNGFSEEEIQQNMKAITTAAPAAAAQKSSPWTILVSLLAIVRGIAWMGKGNMVLGGIILCCGIVGLIAFIAQRA